MRKIKDVLRLKLGAQLSHRQIAAALGISTARLRPSAPGTAQQGHDADAAVGRAPGGRAPRPHGMDADPIDPLATKHRPGDGRSGDMPDGRE